MMKRTLLTKEFTKQVESILAPFFIEQGFSRQGIDHYRRIIKPFIHCIWLQERSDRKALCVNMGVHLDFIPLSGMISISEIDKVVQPSCCIMDRLAPQGKYDYWWPAKPTQKQVKSIKKLFGKDGKSFFEQYVNFPDVFESITIGDIQSGDALKVLPGMTKRGMAVFLARIYEHIRQKEKAIQFSKFGLEIIKNANPRHMRPTKKIFEDIINRNKNELLGIL